MEEPFLKAPRGKSGGKEAARLKAEIAELEELLKLAKEGKVQRAYKVFRRIMVEIDKDKIVEEIEEELRRLREELEAREGT